MMIDVRQRCKRQLSSLILLKDTSTKFDEEEEEEDEVDEEKEEENGKNGGDDNDSGFMCIVELHPLVLDLFSWDGWMRWMDEMDGWERWMNGRDGWKR